MRLVKLGAVLAGLAAGWGCSSLISERNPYLTFTDEYGVAGQQQVFEGGAAGGAEAEGLFRRDLTVTFRNNAPDGDLNASFVAWVNVSSIRSAQQQDALLRGGYSQLNEEIKLGAAHTLAIGTFVYEGGGTAGATSIVLARAQSTATGEQDAGAAVPTTRAITLATPDGILVFAQPPVACDSVAFYFTEDGQPLTAEPVADPESPYSGATGRGGFKTLAQVDVYECEPLRPGLFFSFGGAKQPNEFYEGEDIAFDFFLEPNENDDCATVTVGRVAQPPAGGP